MFQRTFNGSGADEDIVVSSARAYIAAVNKLIAFVSAQQQADATASSDDAAASEEKEAVVL